MQGPAFILWIEILTLACPFFLGTVQFPPVSQRNTSAQHLSLTMLHRCGTADHSCVLLSEKAVKLMVIQASGLDEIDSLYDHLHDVIHLK